MKAFLMCLLLIMGLAQASITQNITDRHTVRGMVWDENKNPLPGATIVLLYPKDSVMAGYSITNTNGQFQIRNISAGEYVMQVSYLGFVNISRGVSVAGDLELKQISLSEESQQLDEVNITADHIPIMLKKDTIEYNSSAFSTQINDKVEALLRQLPGVEIEEDGTIKAQGEKVEKVLVDGKEFFGDDPQIATKNLPANMVDKVQVFDKLSELAEFSGIDDGQRNKTINLTLKEGHKNGMFGDVTGGYGNLQRYEGKMSLNQFSDQKQLSVLSSVNNTNAQNFSIDDYINFSGGLQGLAGGGGGRITLSLDDIGMTPNSGISQSQSSGLNFNYDLSEHTTLESNYFFTGIQNDLSQQSQKENRIESGSYRSIQGQERETVNFNHKLNLRLKHDWNDQDISLNMMARVNQGEVYNLSGSQTFDTEDWLSNANSFDNESAGGKISLSAKSFYRKRLNEKGRTLVMSANLNTDQEDQEAIQKSENRFFENQQVNQMLSINQRQDQEEEDINYGASMNYTEPMGRRRYLSIGYAYAGLKDEFSKEFYDRTTDEMEVFNPTLSNVYSRTFSYHRGGIKYLISREKSKTTVGLDFQTSHLEGTYNQEQSNITKSFVNFLPAVRWSYEISSASALEASYTTSLIPPSAVQLQPFVDNSNPLRTYRGNPDLDAEFAHNLGVNYRLFDMFNFTNLFVSLQGTYTHDKITNASMLTEDYVQQLSPVNVASDVMVNSYISFGTPIRQWGIKVGLDVSSIYGRSLLYINAVENKTDRWINSYDFSLENRKKKVWDLKVGMVLAHNSTHYSQNDQLNQKFSQINYYSHLNLNFLKRWSLKAEFDYKTFLGSSFNNNTSFPLLSASVSRNVFKYDRGQIKFYVFDLLDQNTGVNRINEFNYVEDQRYNTMTQYFMVSFTYSLSKFGQAS